MIHFSTFLTDSETNYKKRTGFLMRHRKTLAPSILQVNIYPTVRVFTAIGTGGDDFVQSMVVAVESVIEERIPEVGLFPVFAISLLHL
jgi:hypothetical protein